MMLYEEKLFFKLGYKKGLQESVDLIKEAISPEYLESKLNKVKDIIAGRGIKRVKRFSPEGAFYTPVLKSVITPRGGTAKFFPRLGNKDLSRTINNLGLMHELNEAKTINTVSRGRGAFDLSEHANISIPKTDLLYINTLKKKYPELEGYRKIRKREVDEFEKGMKMLSEAKEHDKFNKSIANMIQEKGRDLMTPGPVGVLKDRTSLRMSLNKSPLQAINAIRNLFKK